MRRRRQVKPYYCPQCGREYVADAHEAARKKCSECRVTLLYLQLPRAVLRRRIVGPSLTDDVKYWRSLAHTAFDELWEAGMFTRTEAYAWLSREMHLPSCAAHISRFNKKQCQKTIRLCNKIKEVSNV